MARPPHAKERVLDAFEALLLTEGERGATLDAVARTAGVSKGGLLYHFGSKDELASALIARLSQLVAQDVEQMRAAPEGTVEFYLRTSVMENDPLDRAIIAVSRLAQGGSTGAAEALHLMREQWAETIRPEVRDQASLDLVMLLSDGLYFNNALDVNNAGQNPGALPTGADLDALVALVRRATL